MSLAVFRKRGASALRAYFLELDERCDVAMSAYMQAKPYSDAWRRLTRRFDRLASLKSAVVQRMLAAGTLFGALCPTCDGVLDNHGGCWHCEEVPTIDYDTDFVRCRLKADREVTVTVSLTYTLTLPQPMPVESQVTLFNALGQADLKGGLEAQIKALIEQAAGA